MPDKARETKRMTANKRRLPKSLRKPISIDDVTGLAVQLGLLPGKADVERHDRYKCDISAFCDISDFGKSIGRSRE